MWKSVYFMGINIKGLYLLLYLIVLKTFLLSPLNEYFIIIQYLSYVLSIPFYKNKKLSCFIVLYVCYIKKDLLILHIWQGSHHN